MVLPPPSPKPGFGLSPNSGRCAGWLSTTGRRRRPGPKSRPLPGVGNQRGNYKGGGRVFAAGGCSWFQRHGPLSRTSPGSLPRTTPLKGGPRGPGPLANTETFRFQRCAEPGNIPALRSSASLRLCVEGARRCPSLPGIKASARTTRRPPRGWSPSGPARRSWCNGPGRSPRRASCRFFRPWRRPSGSSWGSPGSRSTAT